MTTPRNLWQTLIRWGSREDEIVQLPVLDQPRTAKTQALEIAPNDPLMAYFQSAPRRGGD